MNSNVFCVSYSDAEIQINVLRMTLLFVHAAGSASGDEHTIRKSVVQSDGADSLPKQREIPTVTRML